MSEKVLIHLCGRSREGVYRSGFLCDSTPPCAGYFQINPTMGKVYTHDEAVRVLHDITLGHKDAVVIFKPI